VTTFLILPGFSVYGPRGKAKMQRVSLYTRQSSSRKFKRVNDKQTFAGGISRANTVFVLRYFARGKRIFET